jgi:hypothetical protein
MSVWCPKCRSEYRDGFTVCSDCGVGLVDVLPPLAEGQQAGRHRVSGPFLPGDDVVEVAELRRRGEAELVAAQLRGAGIPAVVFGADTATASLGLWAVPSRVMVRRADRDAAARIVADLEG